MVKELLGMKLNSQCHFSNFWKAKQYAGLSEKGFNPPTALPGGALKVLAVLSMVVDHCAYLSSLSGTLVYWAMRCFGRLPSGFSPFWWLRVRPRDGGAILPHCFGFAVVSEVPWQLLGGGGAQRDVHAILRRGGDGCFRMDEGGVWPSPQSLLAALSAEVSGTRTTGWRGIVVILMFHLFGNKDTTKTQGCCELVFTFPLMAHYGIIGTLLACSVLSLYDGTGGLKSNFAKYAFYVFYPIHMLLILVIISYSIV